MIGPRVEASGDPQTVLLAAAAEGCAHGHRRSPERFSAAFGSGDVDAIMALMTDDCVFESTGPAPDGVRGRGRRRRSARCGSSCSGRRPRRAFTEEESFVAGDRGVLRWRFTWTDDDGTPGHVRGVDVLSFRDGLVAEKLSYVKG